MGNRLKTPMALLGLAHLAFLVPVAWAAARANLDKSGVILKGYDAVSYFSQSRPLKGDPNIKIDHEGSTFQFANEDNKREFLKDPKKFAPQYGGWCAYAVADSKSKVDIDPQSFLIQDGRLLLFYKGLWADTRKKWQRDPRALLKKADANWHEVEQREP